jgi:hypothetical protein
MAFTLSVNAAHVLSFGIELQPQLAVLLSYALAQAPDTSSLDNWADVRLGSADQSVAVPLGSTVPSFANLAAAIKQDCAARFGSSVDVVAINGVLY